MAKVGYNFYPPAGKSQPLISRLAGVPTVYAPSADEILKIPVTGGGGTPEGEIEKNGKELTETLDNRVEPDNPTIHQLAVSIAARHLGDHTIHQICEIYSYMKYGSSSKRSWSYVPDPRGINYLNSAIDSLDAGQVKRIFVPRVYLSSRRITDYGTGYHKWLGFPKIHNTI